MSWYLSCSRLLFILTALTAMAMMSNTPARPPAPMPTQAGVERPRNLPPPPLLSSGSEVADADGVASVLVGLLLPEAGAVTVRKLVVVDEECVDVVSGVEVVSSLEVVEVLVVSSVVLVLFLVVVGSGVDEVVVLSFVFVLVDSAVELFSVVTAWMPPSMEKGVLYWYMLVSLASEMTRPYVFSVPRLESTDQVNEPSEPSAVPSGLLVSCEF